MNNVKFREEEKNTDITSKTSLDSLNLHSSGFRLKEQKRNSFSTGHGKETVIGVKGFENM